MDSLWNTYVSWQGHTVKCTGQISTEKEHSSIICPVWRSSRVFVYELSGSGFEFSCSHLNTKLLFLQFHFLSKCKWCHNKKDNIIKNSWKNGRVGLTLFIVIYIPRLYCRLQICLCNQTCIPYEQIPELPSVTRVKIYMLKLLFSGIPDLPFVLLPRRI